MTKEILCTDKNRVSVQLLGQSGCRLVFSELVVYLDPYLSNSVQELEAADLGRLLSVPVQPHEVTDADWVFVSHDHMDHCDPQTLPGIAKASPHCQFVGPPPVLDSLKDWGVESTRLTLAHGEPLNLLPDLKVHFVPAAHPLLTCDAAGRYLALGYLFEQQGKRTYFAGDTSVTQGLIDSLKKYAPIDTAFLPVNEQNFFRARHNILGNMSIRESFLLAEEIHVRQVVPVHWDMFASNSVYPEEIEIIYHRMMPAFKLILNPSYI